MNIYRMIDANINRVSEGLRVLEDISRFILEDYNMSKSLKEMRHLVRKSFLDSKLITFRDSCNDLGFNISQSSTIDNKEDLLSLVEANFKRVQEGLRSIEESLKILGHYDKSKVYERLRYESYDLEKKFGLKKDFLDTDIYGITAEEFSLGRTNIQVVEEMIKAGIKIIQYREKEKSKLEKYNECKAIRKLTKDSGVTFIVNDDVDIAIAVEADGIHLGQDDMPIEEVRKIAGNMIIGLSTHNIEQAKTAVKKGADYIGVGPIFNTTTKKNVEKSEGLKYLKWVSENIPIPYVAIGGIKESNIIEVKKYGGKCFAMISEIVGSPNIVKKVESIRKLLKTI
ncbi:thiamine phosphate synthase [Caloranaerobacter sp. DY30410]|uniref:thiamine phosphate synthase n=1 Tax=Caloranaerobacter sp. DY30410 TaxID=3238305 RepID=UPI003CFBEC40